MRNDERWAEIIDHQTHRNPPGRRGLIKASLTFSLQRAVSENVTIIRICPHGKAVDLEFSMALVQEPKISFSAPRREIRYRDAGILRFVHWDIDPDRFRGMEAEFHESTE